MTSKNRQFAILLLALFAVGFRPVNSPYPADDQEKSILYRTVTAETKTWDTAILYSSIIVYEVVEPLFVYHLLKRPYELIPLTAESMPQPKTEKRVFQGEETDVVVYSIPVRRGIFYQDHPCFVESNHHLTPKDVRGLKSVRDLKNMDTRELEAKDYLLAVCRLADPRLACPVYEVLARNMLGLAEYRVKLEAELEKRREERKREGGMFYNAESDERLRPIDIDYLAMAEGMPFASTPESHTFEVVLKQPYPQIMAWMSMSFFAPVPPEVLAFYRQSVLLKKNMSLNTDMLGTGPYVLHMSDPIHQVVLEKNRNYRPDFYPSLPQPDPDDATAVAHYEAMKAAGMLKDAGKPIPSIDRIVYRMEKESIPRWRKFLQGYYDESRIDAELFDETVQLSSKSDSVLTPELEKRKIRMVMGQSAVFTWFEINMGDKVIGGYSEKQCKLRRALSIAYDTEEQIELFHNGLGFPSHGPIPPGIFGQTDDELGINPYVYNWDAAQGRPVRKPIEEARTLLAEAGYPDGIDSSGKQLEIEFMTTATTPIMMAMITFLRRQFEKLNIRLTVKQIDGNRLLQNRESGSFQICNAGWMADYLDPENFLFLFNSPPPGSAGNESGYRYHSREYTLPNQQMQELPNSPERLDVIRSMLRVLQRDAPVIFKTHPTGYSLYHEWLHNATPDPLLNRAKYLRIDPGLRAEYRRKYNQPQYGKLLLFLVGLAAFAIPAVRVGIRHLRDT